MQTPCDVLQRTLTALFLVATLVGAAPGRADSPSALGDDETSISTAALDILFEAAPPESPQAGPGADRARRLVFRDRVVAHWFGDNTRFWYRNDLADGAREFVLVDAAKGLRQPAFDHAKLAGTLAKT